MTTAPSEWEVPAYTTREFAARACDYCVVIPVINEGERIGKLLARMNALGISKQADIILVDGGTTDGSLDESALRGLNVRTLLVKTGAGKLSAQLRCAYAYALTQDYAGVVTIDGNNKDAPDAIPSFIDELKRGTDFVQASRFVPGGAAENTPWLRDIAIRLIHAPALSFASGFHWTDTTQGFRAYSRKLLLHPDVQPFRAEFSRYELLAFLSYQAPRLGLVCKELPTTRRYPGGGKVPTKISAVRGNLDLLGTLLNACCGRYNPPEEPRAPAARPWPGLAHVLLGLVLALALSRGAWLVSSKITHQKYSDTVASGLAWRDANKDSDFHALFAFLAASVVLPWALKALTHAAGQGRARVSEELENGMLLSALPAVIFLTMCAWGHKSAFPPSLEYAPYLALPAALLLLCGLLCRKRLRCDEGAARELVHAALLLPLAAIFAGLGVRLLASHYGIAYPLLERLHSFGIPAVSSGVALVCILGAGVFSATVEKLQRRLVGLLTLAQIPLPLLFLTVVPAPIVRGPGAPEFRAEHLPILTWTALAVIGCAWAGLLRRWWRRAEPGLSGMLAPLCLVAIPCFMITYPLGLPRYLDDPFHNGEQLLPWDQLWNHGKLPFVDMAVIHPGPDLTHGLITQVFFDGTSAGFDGAWLVFQVLITVATFYAARACAGTLRAFAAAQFSSTTTSQLFALPIGLFILAAPALLKRPAVWLAVWLGLCPVMLLYNPSVGFAFALGTFPVALWQLWRAVEKSWRPLRPLAIGLAASVALVLAITPLRAMAFGFWTFLVENQISNTVAHGVELSYSYQGGEWGGHVASVFGYELLRSAWGLLPCGLLWLLAEQWFRRTSAGSRLYVLGIMASATACMLCFWSFGRIDAGNPSRSGQTTVIFVTQIVPLLVLLCPRSSVRQVALLGMTAMCGLMFARLGCFDEIEGHASYRRQVYANQLIEDGAAIGMPKLGMVTATPEQAEELPRFKAALAEFLKPGETYLDFTNYQDYYYYLNLPVPALYPATFNVANSTMQKHMLAQLHVSNPPLVLADPAVHFDWISSGLRNYLLYREYTLKYAPVRRGQFSFLVDPARVTEKVSEAEQVAILDHAFSQPNLGRIPSAWGASWSTLSGRFQELRSVETASPELGTYAFNPPLPGTECDMLRLEFDFDAVPNGEPVVVLAWTSDRSGTVQFGCTHKGTFLIALPCEPRFLLSKKIDAITAKVLNPESCTRVKFGTLTLLRMKARE